MPNARRYWSFTKAYVLYAVLILVLVLAAFDVDMPWAPWVVGAYILLRLLQLVQAGPGCIDCILRVAFGVLALALLLYDLNPRFYLAAILLIAIHWIARYGRAHRHAPGTFHTRDEYLP